MLKYTAPEQCSAIMLGVQIKLQNIYVKGCGQEWSHEPLCIVSVPPKNKSKESKVYAGNILFSANM